MTQWDRYQWAAPPAPARRNPWLAWVIAGGCALVAIVVAVALIAWYHRPVSSAHSDSPQVEAFYRTLEAHGFGSMDASDARKWAQDACHGNGLALWGHDDYSAAQSFEFAAVALKVCKAL